MPLAPKVQIGGVDIKNVLEVRYGMHAGTDEDGAPNRGLYCDGIYIRRIQDNSSQAVDWAHSAAIENRKDGSITFVDFNRKDMKTLEWVNGYIHDYAVDFNEDGNHFEESFWIQPETIMVGGEEFSANWSGR